MARSRNLKPGFYKNEFLAQVSPHARLMFAGLWLLSDRRGRLEDRPLKIKGELFPFETVDIETLLQELAQSQGRFITRYVAAGERYIQIENFHKHQNPHRNETESVIPACITENSRNGSNDSSNYASAPVMDSTAREKEQPTPADSLLLIPDSLTLKPEISDSKPEGLVCVSPLEKVTDENQQLAQAGLDYLLSLNHPNFSSPLWVAGYLGLQFQELEQTRPAIPKPEILRLWRDTCDLATQQNKPAPQWSKSTFKNKVEAWTPEQAKAPLADPASPEHGAKAKALLEFPFVLNKAIDKVFPSEALEWRPDSPGGLFSGGNYFPLMFLEGLTEVPAHD